MTDPLPDYSPEVINKVDNLLNKDRERLLVIHDLWEKAEQHPDKCVICGNPPALGIIYCSKCFKEAGYD